MCYPSHHTVVVKIRKKNHKILERRDYFMKRVHAGHITKLPAIPTTNWDRSLKAFLFQRLSISSVPVWAIFRNFSALMVVQTKFWNTNAPGDKEICTLKKLPYP